MNTNNQLEFQNDEISQFAKQTCESSIEDDLIVERLRSKQQDSIFSADNNFFGLKLINMCDFSEERSFNMLRQKKINIDIESECNNDCRNSSFTTAENSLCQSTEFESTNNRDSSFLSNIEFDRSSANIKSNKGVQNKNKKENQQKLILGLSALCSTFNKVETKDVTFTLASLKIFSQLRALNDKKKVVPTKVASPKVGKPDKKKEFYRQWFINQKANETMSFSSYADKTTTFEKRA